MLTEEQYLEKAIRTQKLGSKLSIEEIIAIAKKSDANREKKFKKEAKKAAYKSFIQKQVDKEWSSMTEGQKLQRREDIQMQSKFNQAKAL